MHASRNAVHQRMEVLFLAMPGRNLFRGGRRLQPRQPALRDVARLLFKDLQSGFLCRLDATLQTRRGPLFELEGLLFAKLRLGQLCACDSVAGRAAPRARSPTRGQAGTRRPELIDDAVAQKCSHAATTVS